jgi:hypothetical protein
MFTILRKLSSIAIAAGLIVASSSALAGGHKTYEVTITNITGNIIFTPILVVSHKKGLAPLFELGSPVSKDLAEIAEGGDISFLAATLGDDPDVVGLGNSVGLLHPGASVTVEVSAEKGAKNISIASMLLPTNDAFIALNGVKAPKKGTVTYYSPGYDAGSEFNDEWCMNIPGPQCKIVNGGYMGEGFSDPDVTTDEGYAHISRGIQGNGDLLSATYDWRNPVAKITITRVK